MPFKMFMQCTDTKKYVKTQLDEVRNDETEDLWILVDSIEEATNDPGYVNGHDLNMEMIMFLKQRFGSGSFTAVSPEEPKQPEVFDEEVFEEKADGRKVAILAGGATPAALSQMVDGLLGGHAEVFPHKPMTYHDFHAAEIKLDVERTFTPPHRKPRREFVRHNKKKGKRR